MRKYTQRDLREWVRLGLAEYVDGPGAIPEPVENIGYSAGVYGINGGLLEGCESGKRYVIVGRSSALFYYF